MVDVEAYHMLHRKETADSADKGVVISETSLNRCRHMTDFLVQLPPTIQGFNMTEKKWSMFSSAKDEILH